jgi:hypothetical protein
MVFIATLYLIHYRLDHIRSEKATINRILGAGYWSSSLNTSRL